MVGKMTMSSYRNITRIAAMILFVVALNASAASAGVGSRPSDRSDPNAPTADISTLLKESLDASDDRSAAERYRIEGAEVVPWTQEAALPSPDNAALLYYQAFLLRPKPDDETHASISVVHHGGEPDSRVRVYLGRCRAMIHTAEIAARIPQCTWGIRRFDAKGFEEALFLAEIRRLALVLALDARTLGTDGHYDAAFARCMTLRRLARHAGDDTMLTHSVSLAADSLAQRAIQHVLGLMPADADVLQRLRGQLAAVPGAPASIEKVMQAHLDLSLDRLRSDTALLERIRQILAKDDVDKQREKRTANLTDEDIVTLARMPCQSFLHGIFKVMDCDMPYEQKRAEIKEQTGRLAENCRDNPAASYAAAELHAHTDGIAKHYSLILHNIVGYNALKVAVEVYLVRAQTGRLPEALPAHTPKDPFSGQEFEYEITESGFVLRCRAVDLDGNKTREYDFKVRE